MFKHCVGLILGVVLEEHKFGHNYFKIEGQPLFDFCEALFSKMHKIFDTMIDWGEKSDHYILLDLFVTSNSLKKQYENSPYIVAALDRCTTRISSEFKDFIDLQIKYINHSRATTIKGIGILDHSETLDKFIKKMESSDIENAGEIAEPSYKNLISNIFKWIQSLGEEGNSRHILRIENFYYLSKILNARGVWLDPLSKEVNDLYNNSILDYLKKLSKKHLGSLLGFFDGVDEILKSGERKETLQYHQSHAPHILQQTIKTFGKIGKVEKGLEKQYKKFIDSFTEEQELCEQVWNGWKEYMINKYIHFEELMKVCYKDIPLEFDSSDLKMALESAENKVQTKKKKKDDKKEEKEEKKREKKEKPETKYTPKSNPIIKPNPVTTEKPVEPPIIETPVNTPETQIIEESPIELHLEEYQELKLEDNNIPLELDED